MAEKGVKKRKRSQRHHEEDLLLKRVPPLWLREVIRGEPRLEIPLNSTSLAKVAAATIFIPLDATMVPIEAKTSVASLVVEAEDEEEALYAEVVRRNCKLELQILNRSTSNQAGDLWRDLDPILQVQEDSYQLVSEHPLFERKIDFVSRIRHAEKTLFDLNNFDDSSKDEAGKLAYKSIKTINFFPSNDYLFFEIYFKEIKLFSHVFMENGYEFYFLHSLGTLLEKKDFLEFNSLFCVIPRIHEYYDNVVKHISCMLGIEDKGINMEKDLGAILEELPISLSLNPSLMGHEVSFVQLKLFFASYLSHVSIYGDLCAFSFLHDLFLTMPYMSKYLSSHVFS
ncbi:hypothetical protein M9H77_07539 [Catharanthus roseus]|uniref:Uncharacterized protein n=1 Tax=Catharanthus roseus TaxID=4058 RepID=A0ACC0BVH5_CATRO|nr:hypothetical protein M9H77_07539 [Catharanthus roseus]